MSYKTLDTSKKARRPLHSIDTSSISQCTHDQKSLSEVQNKDEKSEVCEID